VTFTASAGISELTKRWKLKVGDIVSYKHRGFLASSKKPKLPILYRIRQDLTWEDVINNWKEPSTHTRKGNFLFYLIQLNG